MSPKVARAIAHLAALGVKADAKALDAFLAEPHRKAAVHVDDLALAFACARGDAAALAVFEQTWVPRAVRALQKVRIDATVVDDVLGWLRFQLFARDGEPLIATYSGRSDLGGWLRAIVIHEALRRVKQQRRDLPEDAAADVPVPDVELSAMRGAFGAQFTTAMQAGFQELSLAQRNLLRQYFLDNLSIDALADLYRIHRATAARRVQAAREELSANVKRRLKADLKLPDSSIDRLITVENLQVSLSKILRKTNR